MGTSNTYHRTLLHACVIAGDESALAAKLEVDVEEVIGWLIGQVPIPTDVFLRAVDLVLAYTGRTLEATREQIGESKERVEDDRLMLERLRAKYPTGGSKGWPRS
jgi:hypothetical protein